MNKRLLRILEILGMVGILLSVILIAVPISAATSANIDVKATPSYVSISCNQTTYDFGVVSPGVNKTTATTTWGGVTNASTVQTDQTIAVNATTWAGGATWTHSDTAAQAEDTAGLLANAGGSWGTGDVIIKQASPNYIKENLAASTSYVFGLTLVAPTSFTDGAEKSIRITISAAAG